MEIKEEVSLAELSTFKIGGRAPRLVELNDFKDVEKFSGQFKENRFFCVGEGSNVLFPDHKFSRPLLRLRGKLAEIEIDGEVIEAGGGIFLPTLVHETTRRGLSGLEWAAGIPGSLGGAIMMNAGARGNNILNIVTEITYLNKRGEIAKLTPDELDYGYRDSDLPENIIIVSARLEFNLRNKEKTTQAQLENLRIRRLSQPVEVPSAGSVFKNPPEESAGALIERTGLKGASSGDAEISKKHANFIINRGNARAVDVLNLIEQARKRVLKHFDIELELEIRLPGQKSFFDGD